MPAPQFRDAIMILDVRNVDAAITYYCEQLGFEIDFRNAASPDNYAGIRRGNVLLHMQWQSAAEFRENRAGHLRVRIEVDDPDALYAEYRERGVPGLGRRGAGSFECGRFAASPSTSRTDPPSPTPRKSRSDRVRPLPPTLTGLMPPGMVRTRAT